jgi:hypothetical protein
VTPLAAVVAAASLAVSPPHLLAAPKCPIFPAGNPWNARVDTLPVAANSTAIIQSIGARTGLHADFGSGLWEGSPIGIPFNVVSAKQPKQRIVKFEYAAESDKGPYPIPARPKLEGGSDRHVLIVDKDRCTLYELGGMARSAAGWTAWAGAIWNLRSNKLRPETWTSADAAGLPILAGLARWDDIATGGIHHALRFTVERSRRAYVYPARHYASSLTDPNLPPMGLRVRLKASFDVSSFPRQARAVLQALKTYGMIVADNGSSWYITGAPSPHWSNDDLHSLGRVHGSDFEVVDTSSLHP